jgi:hypothetical protein
VEKLIDDMVRRGYRRWDAPHFEEHVDYILQRCFYVEIWNKELGKPEKVKAYFITARVFRPLGDFQGIQFSEQFTDYQGRWFNVELLHPDNLDEVEEFFAKTYQLMGCKPKESEHDC